MIVTDDVGPCPTERRHAQEQVIVAQLGARRHYAVPRALAQVGALSRLYTDLYLGGTSSVRCGLAVAGRLGLSSAQRLVGRFDFDLPIERVKSFQWFGLQYAVALRRATTDYPLSSIYAEFGRRFAASVSRAGFGEAASVYGFNGASLELLRVAKERGLFRILDQTLVPIQIVRDALEVEMERWPGWQPGLAIPPINSALAERDFAEWELSDRIVCGSPFLVEAVAQVGGPAEKCRVVPYGLSEQPVRLARVRSSRTESRLKVLFAGEVGLRKGAPYLLMALKALGPNLVTAKFAGPMRLAPEKAAAFRPVAKFLGRLPREEMASLYDWADILVLPSLCEGSAMVLHEAYSRGLAVICTPNAGGTNEADIIVPPRSSDAIAAVLERMARVPARDRACTLSGPRKAATLLEYGRRLTAVVNEVHA